MKHIVHKRQNSPIQLVLKGTISFWLFYKGLLLLNLLFIYCFDKLIGVQGERLSARTGGQSEKWK
ncbi:hypothetical protein P8610_03010 [Fictibacillus sp. UD]